MIEAFADNAGRHVAVGDGLDLERMQTAKRRDLIKGQGRVLDQPYGGRFGHERLRHAIPRLVSRLIKCPLFREGAES